MIIQPHHPCRKRGGYVTFLIVVMTTLVAAALIFSIYRASMRAQSTQQVAQLQVDISQRENAVMRSLLALVPNAAIGAMRGNSAADSAPYSWDSVFISALTLANAHNADASGVLTGLDVDVSANAADFPLDDASSTFSPVSGGGGLITPGVNTTPSGSYPPHLVWAGADAALDALYPMVTEDKVYGANAAGVAELSVADYPLYNRIPYPNVRFGYRPAGGRFVAKRNWWAFRVRFPQPFAGGAQVWRTYVLSLYEVPSQVAIASASGQLGVGKHAAGTAWQGIDVQGGIYGERILGEESLTVDRMAGREGIDLMAGVTVGGTNLTDGFQEGNTAANYEALNDAYLPASIASDVGFVSFVPLDRGQDFYRLDGSSPDANRLSPTGWDDYSLGSRSCAVRVVVTEMASSVDQVPIEIEVSYLSGGSRTTETFRRGASWPQPSDPGGDAFPFQTETTETGRRAISLYVDRLATWLSTRGADDVAVNNSVLVNVDPSGVNTVEPSFPSLSGDAAVVLRGSADLTMFSKGFSLVTEMRVYLAADVNIVDTTAPPGSGLTGTYYPPVSIIAPEKRWGVQSDPNLVRFRGSVMSMGAADGHVNRPLDFRTGLDQVVPGSIDAVLSDLTSPAHLPPVMFKNWLLTIERVEEEVVADDD